MHIDFSQFPIQQIAGAKGGAGTLWKQAFADGLTTIMLDRLSPGGSIGLHTHTEDCEIIYLLSGTATILCNGQSEQLQAGQCHYCPCGSSHTMHNSGAEELTFFAVLSQQTSCLSQKNTESENCHV